MSIISEKRVNLKEMCRVCLIPVYEPFTELFSNKKNNLITIANAIMECAPVHICEDDGLPAYICERCDKDLEVCLKFRENCIRTDSILQKYYSQLFKQIQINQNSEDFVKTENEIKMEDDKSLIEINEYSTQTTPEEAPIPTHVIQINAINDESSINSQTQNHNLLPSVITVNNGNLEGGMFENDIKEEPIEYKIAINDGTNLTTLNTSGRIAQIINIDKLINFSSNDLLDAIQQQHLQENKFITIEKEYTNIDNTTCILSAAPVTPANATTTSNSQNIEAYLMKIMQPNLVTGQTNQIVVEQQQSQLKQSQNDDDQRPFKCNICNKTFKRHSNLTEHTKIHSDHRPFKCEVCEKLFKRSCDLAEHKRSHSNERPFKCQQCLKCFKRNCDLSEHHKIHTNERPFKCDICQKSFKRNGQFMEHRRIHTGERPYKCKDCDETFRTSSKLSAHTKVHNQERPYKCEHCDRYFRTYKSLTIHSRVHSNY